MTFIFATMKNFILKKNLDQNRMSDVRNHSASEHYKYDNFKWFLL